MSPTSAVEILHLTRKCPTCPLRGLGNKMFDSGNLKMLSPNDNKKKNPLLPKEKWELKEDIQALKVNILGLSNVLWSSF